MHDNRRLLVILILLGILPMALRLVGIGPSLWMASCFLALNIGVCLLGAFNGYRLWWLIYAGACVCTFVLFGAITPVSLFMVLLVMKI